MPLMNLVSVLQQLHCVDDSPRLHPGPSQPLRVSLLAVLEIALLMQQCRVGAAGDLGFTRRQSENEKAAADLKPYSAVQYYRELILSWGRR